MHPTQFIQRLRDSGVRFFAGVPDSLLASLCAELSRSLPPSQNVITANEGAAVAMASGFHLATGQIGCVYMQNSGQGNATNPLASLADPDVYSIPMLLVIGWRGEPGKPDEPQHVKQGKITRSLQETLGIPTYLLGQTTDHEEDMRQIEQLLRQAKEKSTPVGVVVPKGWFDKVPPVLAENHYTIQREAAIEAIVEVVGDLPIVSTTGKISRELYEARDRKQQGHQRDFLTVGSMGHAISIALGVALAKPGCPVVCLDGDGAALMHMGSLAIAGTSRCKNLKHIVLNNAAHESVGGQPTVAGIVSLSAVAKACGYDVLPPVKEWSELTSSVEQCLQKEGPVFLEVCVTLESRADLGRPKTSPQENKTAFMAFLGHNK